ncbi:MAG: CU044_5270 family protein [Actinomycetota bacterium]
MNDLDLLRGFRNDVEGPDPEVVASARQRMFAGGGDDAVSELRDPRRRRPGGRWALASGLAAAAVAIAVAVPALLPGGGSGGADRAKADVLLERAAVAASHDQEWAAPGPDQYVYTKTQGKFLNVWADAGPTHEGFSVLMPETREAWIGTDGSGRLVETTGDPTFPSERDRVVWIAAGRPDLGGNQTHDDAFPAAAPDEGGLFYFDLANLPTDPDKLRELIEDRKVEGGPPGNAETFTIIGDMLRETYAPPALRAALYRIVSDLPGVEYVGPVTDDLGRQGVAVAFPESDSGVRQELIFDQDTAVLLGERTVIVDATDSPAMHEGAGTILTSATYIASGIVDSTKERMS